MIDEELEFPELKEKALDRFAEEEYPALIFDNLQIGVDENRIEILSKNKLSLESVDSDTIKEN